MSLLAQVNLARSIASDEYLDQLARYQALLGGVARETAAQERAVVIVFEGWDAAGKGGCIKRLTEGLDPRGYIVYPMGILQAEDQERHYLYRYWRRLPERGRFAIFDRSWYGRLLGDRVEGRCARAEWERAYREINQFERQQVDFGTIVFKFWLQITREEQARRLAARSASPAKAARLTSPDWQNHAPWDAYEAAAEEMLLKTSTFSAPWTIVEAMDQNWARIKVVRTVAETLVRELKYAPEDVDARFRKKIRRRVHTDPRLSQELEEEMLPSPEGGAGEPGDSRRRAKK